ncbi:activator of 90 kDa heat shock protein ATPase homolog 2-like isoform X2 [Onychostruthus taczanowskii]|uniref:activator of 90 kDa heat shock protein ATPase homolog 2-like isoform X2 n=1 Tax=Onychostruthus taczanowskii TaxID=356909 RepID=UPI001B806682|nr:activator of 90 kDa heat shock protein ATPase homolog 2-like isoform X2 [Onychostruthus taczanowskii]
MAKWGQGDPRWIVEERADATNVNNWHWTERDATSWSKRKLKEVLEGLVVEGEAGRCEIGDLKHVEGEASCNSRKGKLIFFYEWNLRLSWKGTVKESGEKHKGSVEIPNLSEENEVDDTEINVSKKKGEGDALKDLMRTEGTTKVREALRDYLKALKTEFTLGMILPTKAPVGQELAMERKPSGSTVQDSVTAQSLDMVGVKIPTVRIHMREVFNSPADELYSIFTKKEVPSQRIVLKWRCRSWPDEHYATVALNFQELAAQSELELECKGVPVSHEESTRQCWKKQYFEEIHILLQQSKDNME